MFLGWIPGAVVSGTGGEVAAGVKGSAKQARGLDMVGSTVFTHGGEAGWDDEEFGGDEVKLGGEGKETGVERGLGLCLLESLAMVEVCVGKDATQATGKRREMAVRAVRDGESVHNFSRHRIESVYEKWAYREGKARGEFRRAVALSRVCRI